MGHDLSSVNAKGGIGTYSTVLTQRLWKVGDTCRTYHPRWYQLLSQTLALQERAVASPSTTQAL